MAAGSIVIDLLLKTGSFESDTKRAEARLKALEKSAVSAGKIIGGALVASATAAAIAFDRLVKGAADFKDIEEATGGSAEGMASLAVAAETAGIGMDAVSGLAIKLTKNLTGVDDESKAAGAAIKALGLNIAEFKKLAPPEQFDAISKALAGFKDGPEKTAVAFALAGKQGAELLKLSKALEEQGGRTTILTQRQIDLADQYADRQAQATAELKLYAQAAATEALPAVVALLDETKKFVAEIIGLDKETGRLGANTAIRDFAQTAAVAIGDLIDQIRRLAPDLAAINASTRAELKALELGFKSLTANPADLGDFLLRGKGPLQEIRNELTALNKEAKEAAKAVQEAANAPSIGGALRARFSGLTGERQDAFTDPRSTLFGSSRRDLSDKPTLKFNGEIKDSKAKVDELAKAIADLNEELALFGQDDSFKKAFKLEGLGASNQQLAEYRENLARLKELQLEEDINKVIDALVKERNEIGLTNTELRIQELILKGASQSQVEYAKSVLDAADASRKQKELIEEGKRVTASFRSPQEQLNERLREYRELLDAGAISQETFNRAVAEARNRASGSVYSDASDDTRSTMERLRMAEEYIRIAQGKGEIGEIEALVRIGEERRKMIALMEAQVQAQEAIANASGSDQLILDAQRARLELEKLKAAADPLADTFNAMFKDGLAGAFEDVLNGSKSIKDAFKDMSNVFVQQINRMVAEALAADLMNALFGDMKGGLGGVLGGIFGGGGAWGGPWSHGGSGGLLSSLFGGFFADGGDPPVGKPSIVGERGPEWFIPRSAGTIVPAEVVRSVRGGSTMNLTQNFAITGPVDRKTQEQIASASARRLQVARLRGAA